jgi:hypothetical protein
MRILRSSAHALPAPWVVAVSVALALAGCQTSAGTPRPGDAPTLALDGPGGIYCGAVAVAENLAVTAGHCAPGRIVRYVTVVRGGRPSRNGVGFVVRRDVASDLAAFTASGLVAAELSRTEPDPGRATRLVAHAPAPWTAQSIRAHSFDDGFLYTERLMPGASGCGLWSDRGELVGVAIGNDRTSGYFASIPRVSHMLRGTIEVAVSPPETPERSDPDPSVWHDRGLSLDELLTAAKDHRQRIDSSLRGQERPDAAQVR